MSICIFGDSITRGYYDSEQGGWAERLKKYLEEKKGEADVYNLGISGDYTRDVLFRIECEAAAREAQMIVFAIGINDSIILSGGKANDTPNEFKENLENLSVIAEKYTKNIIFVGLTRVDESKTNPIPWAPNKSYRNERIKEYDEAIQNHCEIKKYTFISMEGVLSNNDLEDGVHPNSNGHRKMFEKILPAIESEMKKQGA
jgi:acyl-CoA thioesterase I